VQTEVKQTELKADRAAEAQRRCRLAGHWGADSLHAPARVGRRSIDPGQASRQRSRRSGPAHWGKLRASARQASERAAGERACGRASVRASEAGSANAAGRAGRCGSEQLGRPAGSNSAGPAGSEQLGPGAGATIQDAVTRSTRARLHALGGRRAPCLGAGRSVLFFFNLLIADRDRICWPPLAKIGSASLLSMETNLLLDLNLHGDLSGDKNQSAKEKRICEVN
jgi:hypothetical protein